HQRPSCGSGAGAARAVAPSVKRAVPAWDGAAAAAAARSSRSFKSSRLGFIGGWEWPVAAGHSRYAQGGLTCRRAGCVCSEARAAADRRDVVDDGRGSLDGLAADRIVEAALRAAAVRSV